MSNRKKIKRPKVAVPEPAFPHIRIRERTDEEIDEIIRRKEIKAQASMLAAYAPIEDQEHAGPVAPDYRGGAVPTRISL